MPQTGHSIRRCWIDPRGPGIVLRLTATELLEAAARCLVYPPRAQGDDPLEPDILLFSNEGSETIRTAPGALEKCELFVRLRACALHPGSDEGEIELHVLQNDEPCRMSRPTAWERRVPACSSNQAHQWEALLTFEFLP